MLFSILAFIALVISICIKERKLSLTVQAADCFFEAMYSFVIGAFTGAVLNLMNLIRTMLFIQKEKFSKTVYFVLLLLFEGVILGNCILTWNGPISLLPTIGYAIRTYCLWQPNMKYVRFSGITTGIFYGMYYLYYQSWFLVLGDLILILTGIFAMAKNDWKKK